MILFAYGTLKRGCYNHYYLKGSTYLGRGLLHDYAMVDLGGYPGAIPKEGYKILGERFEVPEEKWAYLDALEGTPTLYKRELLEVELGREPWVEHNYVYVWQNPYGLSRDLITTGEWK